MGPIISRPLLCELIYVSNRWIVKLKGIVSDNNMVFYVYVCVYVILSVYYDSSIVEWLELMVIIRKK